MFIIEAYDIGLSDIIFNDNVVYNDSTNDITMSIKIKE